MMNKPDPEILELLRKDARRPYTNIAQQLGTSEGTVRNRVARLVQNQTVQFVGLIDPNQVGSFRMWSEGFPTSLFIPGCMMKRNET